MREIKRESIHEGFVKLQERTYEFEDGKNQTLEVVEAKGAVGVLAYDQENLYLIRQARAAVGESDLIEIVAGTLDKEGENPLECAKRELSEELSLGAREWEQLGAFYSSPGSYSEVITLFSATGLYPLEGHLEEDERIEALTWPVNEFSDLLSQVRDSKTALALTLWHRAQ